MKIIKKTLLDKIKSKKTLKEKLMDMGFKGAVYPITKNQELLNKYWYRYEKYTPKINNTHLVLNKNNTKWEVINVDIWYTQLRKNNEVLFDERYFNDEELLNLIEV